MEENYVIEVPFAIDSYVYKAIKDIGIYVINRQIRSSVRGVVTRWKCQ